MSLSTTGKILLIGPFPAPVGGVSVHLARLKSALADFFSVDCIDESPIVKQEVFNVRSLHLIGYLRRLLGADLVHVHSSVPLLRFVHSVLSRLFLKRLVITVHSYRDQGIINTMMNALSLRLAHERIAVSEAVAMRVGLRCHVIPAYIRPSSSEMILDSEWSELVGRCQASGQEILVSNAYRLDDFNGGDLYGFDQIIEAFKSAGVRDRWVCFLNVSSLEGCQDKFSKFKEEIRLAGLDEAVHLFNRPLNFCALLKHADVYVRATLTDGDALSVREALSLGVRTIASDAAVRPVGVEIYATGDADNLVEVLLSGAPTQNEKLDLSFESGILDLYREIL